MLALVAALGLVAIAVSRSRLMDARSDLKGQQSRLLTASREVSALRHLQTQKRRVATAERPGPDLAARVGAVGSEVGLPLDSITGIDQQPLRTLSGTRGSSSRTSGPPSGTLNTASLRVQSALIRLDAVDPPTLGRFLERWSLDNEGWTVTQIDLRRSRALTRSMARDSAPNPDAAVYDITLAMESLFIETAAASTTPEIAP